MRIFSLLFAAILPLAAVAQTVPTAPLAVQASTNAGDVSVTFLPPASDGGSPITGYIASCGARSAGGFQSPIVIMGLALGVPVTCTVAATNALGNGQSSTVSNIVTPLTVPSAPSFIFSIMSFNTMAYMNFFAPVSDGGSPILDYTGTCINGGNVFIVSRPPETGIVITGLTNGLTYSCSATARNAVGIGPPTNVVMITPNIPNTPLGSIRSRKVHGSTGVFDQPILFYIPSSAPLSVEPRTNSGPHTLIFRFDNPSGPTPISGVSSVSTTIGNATATFSGLDVTVTLTEVPDNRRVTISLTTQYGSPSFTAIHSVTLGFLVGDVNGSNAVTASDISGIKAHNGQTTDATNFLFDLNTSGDISAADISAAKARSGLVLSQ